MKIRNGFVSNSSTSSFIINAEDDLSTVKDVALYIINTIQKQGWQKFDDEINTLNKITNPDIPIYFNTGGDETYIRKHDGKIVILTTQNASFQEIENNALDKYDLSEDFYKYFDYINEYNEERVFEDPSDFYSYYKKFNDFLVLKHNFFGRHTYIHDCPNCESGISNGWILKNGKEICECQINKIIRREKLQKINESI